MKFTEPHCNLIEIHKVSILQKSDSLQKYTQLTQSLDHTGAILTVCFHFSLYFIFLLLLLLFLLFLPFLHLLTTFLVFVHFLLLPLHCFLPLRLLFLLFSVSFETVDFQINSLKKQKYLFSFYLHSNSIKITSPKWNFIVLIENRGLWSGLRRIYRKKMEEVVTGCLTWV